MSERSSGAYQTKLVQVFFGLAFFLLCVFGVRSAMSGAVKNLGLLASACILIGIVFALDQRFWLLLPFLCAAQIRMPGLPFDGTELGCLLQVVIHWGRVSFRRGSAPPINANILVTFPLILWMAFVFALNPVGMAMLGTEVIGGRFYFKIALAFCAFLSLASLQFSEQDAKFLFRALLFGSLFHAVSSLVSSVETTAHIGENLSVEEDLGSRYYLIPLAELYTILFARWALADFLHAPFRLFLLALTAAAATFSGKRQMFGELALVPFLRVFLTRKGYVVTFVCSIFAAFVLGFMIAGDNTLFSLPQSAKRALAIVVPKYAQSASDGGLADLFRHELRKESYDIIRRNPWLGRKGFAMDLEQTAWMRFGGGGTGLFAGHAYVGNWHNLWLGYACDFGVPGLFFSILVWLYALRYAVRACRTVVLGTYLPSCCLFYSFQLFISICFGWVAGHSSLSTQSMLIQYGFLIAIVNGYREHNRNRLNPHPSPSSFETSWTGGNVGS